MARLPAANVGDRFTGATVGVIDYSFGNFKLEVTSLSSPISGACPRGRRRRRRPGSYRRDVQRREPESGDPQAKFDALADQIVDNLQLARRRGVEEIQDNNGTTNNGDVNADVTWTS